jgi:hypothetical protein
MIVNKSKMKKWFKWLGGVLAIGAVALQLTNPPLTNPAVLPGHDLAATNAPPPEIAAVIKRACYDCHSFQTVWPWYSHVAPVSWIIVNDVNSARGAMNFSDWPHDDQARVRKRWRHIADDVEAKEMPLRGYAIIHPPSRLSDDERAKLVQWARKQASE